ncbi:MAG: holo-ACP synthase [Gammaproteobacteria bacterium]|nr:MAG: holo-ACP synthase [Gammaproteobacteria bacterium]
MIFGIGVDILRAERVHASYARFGERFAERLLMPEELRLYRRQKNPGRFLAMRFAAKEAVVKAMGTGFANGMWIRDAGVLPDRFGRPEIVFSERGRAKCAELGIGDGHLTLSDEAGLIVAVVVLMRTGVAE